MLRDLNATRWTSTATTPAGRAPFGGRSLGGPIGLRPATVAAMQRRAGLPAHVWKRTLLEGGCGRGCGCTACAQGGLGSISPNIIRNAKAGETPELTVRNYVTSAGPWDPGRMISALSGALNAQGVRTVQSKVTTYPLIWSWAFDAPHKVYQAQVVNDTPFKRAMDGIGPLLAGGTPSAQDSANLPSVGTVISFDRMQIPSSLNLNILLGELRTAKTSAARGSNASGGQLELLLSSKPKSSVGWLAGLVILGLYALDAS